MTAACPYCGKEIGPDDDVVPSRVIQRPHGDYLAVTPNGFGLRIGVTAATEDQARAELAWAVKRWRETLSAPETGDPNA